MVVQIKGLKGQLTIKLTLSGRLHGLVGELGLKEQDIIPVLKKAEDDIRDLVLFSSKSQVNKNED